MTRHFASGLGAFFLFSFAATAQAATYHVATDGDDGDDGSSGAPWATLQHAADVVGPGDTVIVHPGSYAGFYLETSGEAAMPITFQAMSGVTIDEDNDETPDGINLEGASYVVVQGFTVVGRTRTGIRAVTAEHVTIRNNRCDMNGRWGILTGFIDDALIEGNECSRSEDEHGIYVSNSGDRPVIRGNRLWGNHANGLHMNGDASEGGDGIISEALVEENVIWDNGTGGGSGINCDGVQDSTIQNNLLYENHASGISLYQIDGGGPATGNLVINNTIVEASDARWAINIQDASSGNSVVNNILFNRHSTHGAIAISADSLSGFTSDYNVLIGRFVIDDGSFIDLATWREMTGQDAHSIESTIDAVFVDAAGDDYHLSTSSPAIDAGTSADAPSVDYEGEARPMGDGIDIGADETCPDPCSAPPDAGVPADAGTSSMSDGGPTDVDAGTHAGVDAGSTEDAGGAHSDAGGSTDDAGPGATETGGCGCRAGTGTEPGSVAWLLALVALAFVRRRGSSAPE